MAGLLACSHSGAFPSLSEKVASARGFLSLQQRRLLRFCTGFPIKLGLFYKPRTNTWTNLDKFQREEFCIEWVIGLSRKPVTGVGSHIGVEWSSGVIGEGSEVGRRETGAILVESECGRSVVLSRCRETGVRRCR